MIISSKILSCRILQNLNVAKVLSTNVKPFSARAQPKLEVEFEDDNTETTHKQIQQDSIDSTNLTNYRFIYPEFLPDPNPLYRNSMREKLERMDMLARRSVIAIPEFYVGSVLAVTYTEPHATGKVNRFVGICILKEGAGLRASILLRNVINGEGIEVRFDLYDPAIQKVDCLRLEKRLDRELLYLRDAPPEYSTFPVDMEVELPPKGAVPVNDIKVPLKPQPWSEKWELKNMKGIQEIVVSEKRQKKAKASAKPWEQYDLMKMYRETIPEEEQIEIFLDIHKDLCQLEVRKDVLKRQRVLPRPRKSV